MSIRPFRHLTFSYILFINIVIMNFDTASVV